jgi:hypothetical protein
MDPREIKAIKKGKNVKRKQRRKILKIVENK